MRSSESSLFGLPAFVWRLILAAAVIFALLATRASAGPPCPCSAPVPPLPTVVADPNYEPPKTDSWIFRPGRYTHDPATGGRVAQYAMKPAIEPLDDPRLVTSGYSRSRTVLRGADGSADTYYRVTSYGNGRGGLDAEWERFHDAWRGSTVAGGSYQVFPGSSWWGGWGGGGGGGWGNPGWGGPGWGGPGNGPWQAPGFRSTAPFWGFGPGFGQPDAGRLDPDGADGFREQRPRTPDRQFFNGGLPPREHLLD
jgi:hypothetical protein